MNAIDPAAVELLFARDATAPPHRSASLLTKTDTPQGITTLTRLPRLMLTIIDTCTTQPTTTTALRHLASSRFR